MRTIRRRLSYANLVSTLALFLVLTGGAAYAAHRYLTRKSVGTPQLKANAVTTAKIKANSITTRKIKRIAISSDKLKENAVTTEKIADGAVNSEKIAMEQVPFTRVAARMRTLGTLSLGEEPQVFPLNTSGYTQAGNELDSFAGEVKVTLPAKCNTPREASAAVLVDPKTPKAPTPKEIFAAGEFSEMSGSGAASTTIELQPGPAQMLFEPGAPTRHTVDLTVSAICASGGGAIASSGQVDVVATK
jgi:hypothetical protein